MRFLAGIVASFIPAELDLERGSGRGQSWLPIFISIISVG